MAYLGCFGSFFHRYLRSEDRYPSCSPSYSFFEIITLTFLYIFLLNCTLSFSVLLKSLFCLYLYKVTFHFQFRLAWVYFDFHAFADHLLHFDIGCYGQCSCLFLRNFSELNYGIDFLALICWCWKSFIVLWMIYQLSEHFFLASILFFLLLNPCFEMCIRFNVLRFLSLNY